MNPTEIPLKDLGVQNYWKVVPAEVSACFGAKHVRTDVDLSGDRGIDHVVTCQTCRIVWHYDSSD